MRDHSVEKPDPAAVLWEYRAEALGPDVDRQLADLLREGWELELVATPHYGTLLRVGYFRRMVTRLTERTVLPQGERERRSRT